MAFLIRSDNDLIKKTSLKDEMDILEDIKTRLVEMQERIDTIERVLSERLPPDILTERQFREEVKSSDEIINEIISKVEKISESKSIKEVIENRLEQKLSPVESRRIEVITGLLQQHGKLSSPELASQIGLSRTRCNEYFKQMEKMGIVEPVLVGREKFYRLS
jgi:biotin operon repressor